MHRVCTKFGLGGGDAPRAIPRAGSHTMGWAPGLATERWRRLVLRTALHDGPAKALTRARARACACARACVCGGTGPAGAQTHSFTRHGALPAAPAARARPGPAGKKKALPPSSRSRVSSRRPRPFTSSNPRWCSRARQSQPCSSTHTHTQTPCVRTHAHARTRYHWRARRVNPRV